MLYLQEVQDYRQICPETTRDGAKLPGSGTPGAITPSRSVPPEHINQNPQP